MNLEKIKEIYLENLKFYNELYPIRINNTKKISNLYFDEEPSLSIKDTFDFKKSVLKMKKKLIELENNLNQIGNPKIWRRGEPLNHLDSSLRERIEKALKFGI